MESSPRIYEELQKLRKKTQQGLHLKRALLVKTSLHEQKYGGNTVAPRIIWTLHRFSGNAKRSCTAMEFIPERITEANEQCNAGKLSRNPEVCRPCAWGSPGNLRFEIEGQAKKSTEAVEGDVGDVAYAGGTPDLHRAQMLGAGTALPLVTEHRQEEGQRR